MRGILASLGLAGFWVALASGAQAVEVDADIAAATDYVERGVSVSDGGAVAQGGLTLSYDSGFYWGGFASSLSNTDGDDAETEIFGGYSFESGAYEIDLSVSWIGIHSEKGTSDFTDLGVTVSRDFGLAYVSGGLRYAPNGRRDAIVDSAVYLFADVEVPIPTMSWATLALHVGHESLGGASDKLDWSAGAYFYVKGVEVNFTYYDTDWNNFSRARSRFVVGTKFYF